MLTGKIFVCSLGVLGLVTSGTVIISGVVGEFVVVASVVVDAFEVVKCSVVVV